MGDLEFSVLLAVAREADAAYGAAIRRDVSTRARRDYSVGAIYSTLQRLEDKRLLTSRESEPMPVRGGRARRYFMLTVSGRGALRAAAKARRAQLRDLPFGWRPA
jgi:DNA-binding PadR family transcriptional regulator